MALKWMDSFDHYATAQATLKYTNFSGGPVISAGNGRRSTQCLRMTGGTQEITTSFTPGDNTVISGFAYKPNSLAQDVIIYVMQSGSRQMSIVLTAAGAIEVRRDNASGTLLGTSAGGVVAAGAYQYIEFKALISTTVGTCTVRVNGVTVVGPLTSLNNAQAGVSTYTGVKLAGSGTIGQCDWDDWYVMDGTGSAPWADFLGDIRVDALMPTAEGATINWTPSTGTDNALTVDEIPPNSDTDYNSSSVTNDIDTLVCPDAPVAGATIFGIQTNIFAKKTDAGTCTIAPVIRSTSDFPQTTVAPGTSYGYFCEARQTDPNTSAQWTEANFNAAQFGYKRIS